MEISKELILECVIAPCYCCCMPLLHDGPVQLCMQKYITSRQRGVYLHPPYPPKSATEYTLNSPKSVYNYIEKLVSKPLKLSLILLLMPFLTTIHSLINKLVYR